MRISRVSISNYRCFQEVPEIRFGISPTIIGKNDAGKSCILCALEVFDEARGRKKPKIDETDFYQSTGENDHMRISISFTDLPSAIALEEGVATNFRDENLLDSEGELTVIKSFFADGSWDVRLLAEDFIEEDFKNLCPRTEAQLNSLCNSYDIDYTRAGRSITNKGKRDRLREEAENRNIRKEELEIELSKKQAAYIVSLLPTFEAFRAESRLGVGETSFQSEFRTLVEDAVNAQGAQKDGLESGIKQHLKNELDKIHEKLKLHTDTIVGLQPEPSFGWKNLVTFDVLCTDSQGVTASIAKRGAGLKRLLMVSFFQYLAERAVEGSSAEAIYAIEEPEAFLYPKAQRDLADSLHRLAERGIQVIITSHSPVFAGSVDIDDLVLLKREEGVAEVIQTPRLNLDKVAEELEVLPSTQIFGADACVFVEGPDDETFFRKIAITLRDAGRLDMAFDDAKVCFDYVGGDNLKHYVERRLFKKINRNYAVIVDSDKESVNDTVDSSKLEWKRRCEQEGGLFFILKKRSIENYLHEDVFEREFGRSPQIRDFMDMKELRKDPHNFPYNIGLTENMTAPEILERDSYLDDAGNEKHELLEILQEIFNIQR